MPIDGRKKIPMRAHYISIDTIEWIVIILFSALLAIMIVSGITSRATRMDLQDNGVTQIYSKTIDGVDTAMFVGRIDEGSIDNLIDLLDSQDFTALQIRSPGGLIDAGWQLAHEIESRDLTVTIDANSYCISACALAALSSARLSMGENSIIAFHPATIMTDEISKISTVEGKRMIEEVTRGTMATMIFYLQNLGFGQQFIEEMLDNSDKEVVISFASIEELYKFKRPADQINSNGEVGDYTIMR